MRYGRRLALTACGAGALTVCLAPQNARDCALQILGMFPPYTLDQPVMPSDSVGSTSL